MNAALEELLGTLLFEGYALYPYTPGATKNATPTPFGIVYPPAYALQTPSTFDKLRMQGVALADGDAVLSGEVRFLQGAGKGHQAVPRRLDAPGRTLADLAAAPHVEPFEIASLHGRVRMAAEDLGEGRWRVLLCVHNTTPVAEGLDRPGALGHSLLSTHPVLTIEGGRFVSPLGVAGGRERQHLPGARHRRRRRAARRGDHAARPPAARAREPRRPLRRHRDRGGAAAARARPVRRRARGDRRRRPRGARRWSPAPRRRRPRT